MAVAPTKAACLPLMIIRTASSCPTCPHVVVSTVVTVRVTIEQRNTVVQGQQYRCTVGYRGGRGSPAESVVTIPGKIFDVQCDIVITCVVLRAVFFSAKPLYVLSCQFYVLPLSVFLTFERNESHAFRTVRHFDVLGSGRRLPRLQQRRLPIRRLSLRSTHLRLLPVTQRRDVPLFGLVCVPRYRAGDV